jgi:hypothetical protein
MSLCKIYGPKDDGTYIVEFRTAARRGARDLCPIEDARIYSAATRAAL